MSNGSRTRSGQEKVRRWCHDAIDAVDAESQDGLSTAENLLQEASDDSVRQKLVELSVSEDDEITAIFVRAAVRTGSTQLARAAADLLMDITEADSALAVIRECLEADDLSVQRRAVEALETLEDPGALELLQEALQSEEDGVRRAATNSFGLMVGSKYHALSSQLLDQIEDSSSPLFRTVVNSNDISLRREVAQSLGFARSSRVLPLLEAFSRDDDPQTRREAVLALAPNTGERSTEILYEMLDDPDGTVVASVLDALAARYGRDSARMLDALKVAMRHPDSGVRRHAVLMLNQFDPQQVTELLEESAHDEDVEVQRSANSLLRKFHVGGGLPDFGPGAPGQQETENTLNIWEAGNIGIESDTASSKSTIDARSSATAADMIPRLEEAAAEGDEPTRQHAITELTELCDIADSPALQKAINDPSEAIRNRVATALSTTRDAGMLVNILNNHTDPLLRRNAVEALMDNPSSHTLGGDKRKRLTFSSERSQGMILYSHFLDALTDSDEGVRQLACRAIDEFVEFDCPMPVQQTSKLLNKVSEDENLSSLTRDMAQELLENLEDADVGETLVDAMDGVLELREDLTRYASALQRNDEGQWTLSCPSEQSPADVADFCHDELRVDLDQRDEIQEACEENTHLPNDLGPQLERTLFDGIVNIYRSTHHACRALDRIGEDQWHDTLQQWLEKLQESSSVKWQQDSGQTSRATILDRYRQQALCAALKTLSPKGSKESSDRLRKLAEEADDPGVIMAALQSLPGTTLPEESNEQLMNLARSHAEDPWLSEQAGRTALRIIRADSESILPGLKILRKALPALGPDLRYEMVQTLMTHARQTEIADKIRLHLSQESPEDLSGMGFALALMGATGELPDCDMPSPTAVENSEMEYSCAVLALNSMQNEPEAADRLKEMLRVGNAEERRCATLYLGLARVPSALPVWASTSDQVELPWPLRTLNASMLVRMGHRLGMRWFNKNATQRTGGDKPPMALNLARAIEDILPLMLECDAINVGRFV